LSKSVTNRNGFTAASLIAWGLATVLLSYTTAITLSGVKAVPKIFQHKQSAFVTPYFNGCCSGAGKRKITFVASFTSD
jgi:hypothetical protein